jgi:hypothetical protein
VIDDVIGSSNSAKDQKEMSDTCVKPNTSKKRSNR